MVRRDVHGVFGNILAMKGRNPMPRRGFSGENTGARHGRTDLRHPSGVQENASVHQGYGGFRKICGTYLSERTEAVQESSSLNIQSLTEENRNPSFRARSRERL